MNIPYKDIILKNSFCVDSTNEAKGSECYDAFKTMQECMLQYPTVYGKEDKPDETEDPLADDSNNTPEEPSAEVETQSS